MDFNDAKTRLTQAVEQDETPTEEQAAEETQQQQQLAQQEQQQAQQQQQFNAQQQYNAAQQQMAQIQQQMGALMERNKQLEQMITQQNEVQQEAIEEEMTTPTPPVLDWDGMEFEDEETRQQKFNEYQQAHDDYLKQALLQELEPTLKYAREAQQEQEQNNALAQIKQEPKFADIENYMPKIRQVMKAAPNFFSGEDTATDLLNGYLIAKGIAAVETPQTPKSFSPEELVNAVLNNPQAASLMETKRLAQLENRNVPAMSASSGAGNAALNTQTRPSNFKESKSLLQKLFGLK